MDIVFSVVEKENSLHVGNQIGLVTKKKQISENLINIATTNDRGLLETDIDGITEIELEEKKDSVKHARGGIDEPTAKILAQYEKAYILSFYFVKNAKNSSLILSRMIQNVQVCKKIGVPVLITSMAREQKDVVELHDMQAFFISMGVDEQVINLAGKEMKKWIERCELRNSTKYIAEGITRL